VTKVRGGILVGCVWLATTTALAAQTAPRAGADSLGGESWLARRLNGQAQVFSEAYGISGAPRRRPGGTWRFMASPRVRLLGGTEVGLDLLLSSEGNSARQNINQVAFEPDWGWGQLHLGDFARDYSPYTMQGLRIRGAGLDISRWGIRGSLQGGRSAALVTTPDGPQFRRQVIAGAFGVGREGERSLDLRVVRAQDALVADDVFLLDTLGLDTLPADLRPQQRSRPQENVVASVASTWRLLQRRLSLRGEVAGALLTRDLTSPAVDADSSDAGGITTLRTSSSGDAAWNLDAQWQGRSFGLRGGVESVGAGFTSLGLAYLINDRRSWHAGGDLRLGGGRAVLQGRVQRQLNNVSGQRSSTTTREVLTGNATFRLPADFSASFVALLATAGNRETNDTLLVDNATSTLSATLARAWTLGGRSANASLAWSLQSTEDKNPIRLTPAVQVQTANLALALPLASWLSVAPAVSAVLPSDGVDGENVLGSLRLTVHGLRAMTASANASQTFVSARAVTSAGVQWGWELPGDIQFSLQGRYMRFGALGLRPGFSERFLTTTLARSF